MLVVHGLLCGGEARLWAEERREKVGASTAQRLHPFAARVKDFEVPLRVQRPASDTSRQFFVWLPSIKKTPIPSSPLLGVTAAVGAAELLPWRVETLLLGAGGLLALAELFAEEAPPRPGIVASPSLHYCLHAARFAVSLAARQQVLPGLDEVDGAPQACWRPIFVGADRDRLEKLAAAMPSSVRAISESDREAPVRAAAEVLREYLRAAVNEYARPLKSSTAKEAKKSNPHRHWVQGLSAAEPTVANGAEYSALRTALDQWTQPLLALSSATHRIAFRLEEPPGSGSAWILRPLLQGLADESLYLPVEEAWKPKSAVANLKAFALSELGNAAGIFPPVGNGLKGKRPVPVELGGDAAMQFLGSGAGALEQAGFRVLLPSWWTRTGTKQRLVARGKARSTSKSVGLLSMESMVKFTWELAIGDKSVTIEELQALALAKSPLVKVRGQWVHVSVDEIQAALKFWKKKGDGEEINLAQLMRLSLGLDGAALEGLGLGEIEGTGAVGKFLNQFKDASKLELLHPPGGFQATLRPYHVRGYSWLAFLQRLGLGACLADDMGLGKTIQALALIQRDREAGAARPVLLVCPTSVLGNWQREAAKFTPSLRVALHHGPQRAKNTKALEKLIAKHDMIVTTYALLHRDVELLREKKWRAVFLDEAQNIKNHGTRQAKAARTLTADYRIALSGTPVENHAGELWSILEFLNPGLLGTQAHFDRTFLKPIQREADEGAAESLRRATGPFVLRRLKTDKSIIADLPDKIENTVYCQLTKEQGSLYAAALKEAEERLESTDDGIQRKGVILGLLSRLKQICNHPAQFLGDHSSVDGRSGKLTRLAEMIGEMIEGGERALVFTQFTEMGAIIKPYIEERFGREVQYLHGSVTKKRRDEMVRRFQEDDAAPPVFLLSLRAGGTGLTLTRATHVFHFDRWWNPAVEDQATDRAFRIGQKKNVQVHKFVCIGTLEDRIDEMIRRKKELADKIVGTGEGWITELSNRELKEVIALGKDAVLEGG